MKIAIIGTHSTGKTTLLNELKKYIELPIITEIARKFSRDITDDPTMEMMRQSNIFCAQLMQEIKYNNGFLSDRSTIDNAAYMILALQKYGHQIPLKQYIYITKCIKKAIEHGQDQYDYLFYIPVEFDAIDDGFRNMDEVERENINFIIKMSKPFKTIEITGTVEERVNKVLEYIL